MATWLNDGECWSPDGLRNGPQREPRLGVVQTWRNQALGSGDVDLPGILASVDCGNRLT
ncbi:hypothetical protein BM1_09970 [Bipolaris maydis]|nr:hypothetical protein BM1_09970 [Bipolaris maydis]